MDGIGNAIVSLFVFAAFAAPTLLGCLIALVLALSGFSQLVYAAIALLGLVAGVALAINAKVKS